MLESSVWNNTEVKNKAKMTLFDVQLIEAGYQKVKHFLKTDGRPHSFPELVKSGFPKGKYLTWLSVVNSIPPHWKKVLKSEILAICLSDVKSWEKVLKFEFSRHLDKPCKKLGESAEI